MRRNLFLKVIPMLLILLLLCSGCFCAFAEEGLPAYTGKLTVEDSFDEETVNWFLDRMAEEKFYTYDPARPEWMLLRNWSYVYKVGFVSGEPIKNCTIEQLSGPTDVAKFFKFQKKDSYVSMPMDKISQATPGTYRLLLTAEGDTRYARRAFSFEIIPQPKKLAPVQVRPLLILNTLDKVQNPLESVVISAPDEANLNFQIKDPNSRWFTTYHPEAESGKAGGNYILDWTEEGQFFKPESEGAFKGQVSAWLGQVLSQKEIPFDVIVSSTLSYDDFALSLTPQTLQAAGGQKVKIEAAFADPEEVNAKAKNNGIDWIITTPDGGDASEFATVSAGTVTIKKLTKTQDLVVTARSQMVPDKSASVTIHAVPLSGSISAEADKDTLYLVEGADQAQISVTAEPADAVPAITYKSSSDKIATVDENGQVKAVSAGNVTITASTGDGSKKKATVKLKVLAPVTGITLSATQDSVAPGKTVKLKATLEPEKPSEKTLTYTIGSADAGLAEYLKISKDGAVSVAKGCPAGSFTVQVSANGAAPASPVTAEITLSVTE